MRSIVANQRQAPRAEDSNCGNGVYKQPAKSEFTRHRRARGVSFESLICTHHAKPQATPPTTGCPFKACQNNNQQTYKHKMNPAAGAGAAAASQASVAELARREAVRLHRCAPKKQDTTYLAEQQRYCFWVNDMRRQNLIPPGDRFLTRENVDLYFTRVIAGKTFKPESARRVVSALQWYADQIEYAGDPQGFQVDQKVVKEALEIHTTMYIEWECSKVKDPHLNLPTDRR